jgi:hypothetical protein
MPVLRFVPLPPHLCSLGPDEQRRAFEAKTRRKRKPIPEAQKLAPWERAALKEGPKEGCPLITRRGGRYREAIDDYNEALRGLYRIKANRLDAPATRSQQALWLSNTVTYVREDLGPLANKDGTCDASIVLHCGLPDEPDIPLSQMEEHIVPTIGFFAMLAMRKMKQTKAANAARKETYIREKIRAREARWDF